MTNNEKKSNEKWSLKKTILLIVLVVLLFGSLFSCGLNVFKTTYNKVNQVNYDEITEILTDYTSFNKVDRDIKKANASSIYAPIDNTLTYNSIKIDTTGYSQNGLIEQFKDYPLGVDIVNESYYEFPIYLMNETTELDGFLISIRKTFSSSSNLWTLRFEYVYALNGEQVQDTLCSATSSTYDFASYTIVSSNNQLNLTLDFSSSISLPSSSTLPSFYEYNSLYLPFITGAFIESGGSYTPNPQYNIVQPSISGDLVLGTMFEPMLDSQTTFAELYVSYIIGQSNSVYSLNLVINLVLEGTNNYVNVPISTTLNINDLSNNSYTQVIAKFDSELEELNLVIKVSSNNNVIYTYDNSFPCVMNNSFTYPYQVNGFSNTQTAKQYVSSYNSTQGYTNGYNVGNREGYASGYDTGYDEGYDTGYDEGYNYTDDNGNYRGYEQGYHDGSNNEFAKDGVKDLVNIIFNAPYNIFNGFLNFEIFGVNLFNLLSFIFTLVLVGWIIALLMKR